MRILIAPDKFKGSLSAQEVSDNIALGVRDAISDAAIEIAPMADGGEGTADAICKARGGKWVTCSAHGPLGDPIEASYVWLGESAVMEMSETAGMRRLKNARKACAMSLVLVRTSRDFSPSTNRSIGFLSGGLSL